MKFLSKGWMRTGMICACALALLCFGNTAKAEDIEDMENQSSNLKNQLSGVNQEILDIGNQIADVEEKITETSGEIEKTQEQLAIAKSSEAKQYEDLKLRIKYMYENGSTTMLEILVSAENMNDFLNRADFIQNISEYDRNKLEELRTLRTAIAEQEEYLVEEQDSQLELQEQLDSQKAALQAKADEMSTDLASLQKQITELREEQARKEAEAKKKEEEKKAAEAAKNDSSKKGSGSSSSKSNYDMPSGNGVLTKHKGVNYFNGHKETYYSQRVLPGYGLNIPGRHVASDGTIRDKDGYICVASSDYSKGTVVQTSLGPGKVYDSGCASGTIDLYTDW